MKLYRAEGFIYPSSQDFAKDYENLSSRIVNWPRGWRIFGRVAPSCSNPKQKFIQSANKTHRGGFLKWDINVNICRLFLGPRVIVREKKRESKTLWLGISFSAKS